MTTSSSDSAMPSSRAMARAVAGWSPVIIFTATPARWQSATACFASGPQRVDEADETEEGQFFDLSF